MTTMSRLRALIGVIVIAALLTGGYGLFRAEAHEPREVADQYSFVVGFLVEPAFAGEQNGLALRIATLDPSGGVDSEPVEGAEETLSATVGYGDLTMPLEIEPVSSTPGTYRAIFFPTMPGDYTFTITGTIGETTIDETFSSADGEFGAVQDPAPLQFPPLSGTPVAGTPAAATPTA